MKYHDVSYDPVTASLWGTACYNVNTRMTVLKIQTIMSENTKRKKCTAPKLCNPVKMKQ